MKTSQSISILKALADKSRLAIINSLLERSQYVEEIAKRLGLATSTVSFHLRKLELAGLVSSHKEQYYVVFQVNSSILNTTLREIVSAPTDEKELQDERMNEYRRKVLEVFFRHGTLMKLPSQHKKRLLVLEEFVARLEPTRRYSESEVTELIKPLFDDYCTIRRLLVDEGLIHREGAIYWRDENESGQAAQRVFMKGSQIMKKESNRAETKRLYKQNISEMGVYQIKNRVNGKIYIDSSKNIEGTRNSRLFQLKIGKIVFSHGMQKELNEFGAENFEFSVLDVLDKPESEDNIDRLLTVLELHWLEKLQPFGELGYNSIEGFQRNFRQLSGTQEWSTLEKKKDKQ